MMIWKKNGKMAFRLSIEIHRLFRRYLHDLIVSKDHDNRSNISDINGNVEFIDVTDKGDDSIVDDNLIIVW